MHACRDSLSRGGVVGIFPFSLESPGGGGGGGGGGGVTVALNVSVAFPLKLYNEPLRFRSRRTLRGRAPIPYTSCNKGVIDGGFFFRKVILRSVPLHRFPAPARGGLAGSLPEGPCEARYRGIGDADSQRR